MRSFEDERGNHWQAALLEGSFGDVLVIFSRIGRDETRQNSLDAINISEAEQWLDGIDEAGLKAALTDAVPWQR